MEGKLGSIIEPEGGVLTAALPLTNCVTLASS